MKRIYKDKQLVHVDSAVFLPPTNLDIPMPPVKPPRKEIIQDGVKYAYVAKEGEPF